MNILIVEDNTSSRVLLRNIIKHRREASIVTCSNGKEAVEELAKANFDIVLTDWMMPLMNGLELTTYIRENIKPAPIILMITALASHDAMTKALSAGVDDFIAKPYSAKDILLKIENALLRCSNRTIQIPQQAFIKPSKSSSYFGVAIAASTGGPQALLKFFSLLLPTEKAAFFVVLHAPVWMLISFAERLQKETKMKVNLGINGMSTKPGEVYLAPGDYHMILQQTTKNILLADTPPENFVKPAADPLFKSVAENFGNKSVGVVLTGMGQDGSIGAGYINTAGGIIMVENPKTALLNSMPKSVVDLRLAKVIAKLDELPAMLNAYISEN